MKIREIKEEDVEELSRLFLDYSKEEESMSGSNPDERNKDFKTIKGHLRNFSKKEYKAVFVAEANSSKKNSKNNNEIVGFLIGLMETDSPLYKRNYVGIIDELYVKPSFRGRGISSKLKKNFTKWFKKRKKGKGLLKLEVATKNRKAQKAYESWGFKKDFYLMTKKIK